MFSDLWLLTEGSGAAALMLHRQNLLPGNSGPPAERLFLVQVVAGLPLEGSSAGWTTDTPTYDSLNVCD